MRALPKSIVIARMATGLVTLVLVVFVMKIAGEADSARWIAGGVLAFGVLQWLFLGRLGRHFQAEDEDAAALPSERADALDDSTPPV